MPIDKIQLSRKELYDMVWSEPITRLAKKYGFSDTWLARICRKNNIPRPPRGYWAIIQSGGNAPKTPLFKGDKNKIIEIYIHDPKDKKKEPLSREKIAKKISWKILIPKNQTDPHKLITETSRVLTSAKQDETGLLSFQKGCLNIHVSRSSLTRVLCIMDTLIKILSNMKYDVIVIGEFTQVIIDGIKLHLAMHEELETKRRLRAADHRLEGYYEFGYGLYEKTLHPSGRLCFSIEDPDSENPQKKIWRDSDLKKLEDYMKAIVLAVIRMAVRKKAYLIDKETANEQESQNI